MNEPAGEVTVRVRVPASSANLGPGFDTLGLALGLHDEIELTAVEDDGSGPGGIAVEVSGEGERWVPRDERHLVLRAVHATFALVGVRPPGLRLVCRNAIPHSRGLGSSAAAAVAGVLGARGLLPRAGLTDAAVLSLAASFDGHADNAAASLYGGLVVCWYDDEGQHGVRLDPHPGLSPVVYVAEGTSSTEATRGLLPEQVPHADAAFTGSRAALAVHAFTAAPELLLPATDDRLHQPYRRPAYPASSALVDALRAAGVAAAVSGAGPTVLALPADGQVPDGVPSEGFAVRRLPLDTAGARVQQL